MPVIIFLSVLSPSPSPPTIWMVDQKVEWAESTSWRKNSFSSHISDNFLFRFASTHPTAAHNALSSLPIERKIHWKRGSDDEKSTVKKAWEKKSCHKNFSGVDYDDFHSTILRWFFFSDKVGERKCMKNEFRVGENSLTDVVCRLLHALSEKYLSAKIT